MKTIPAMCASILVLLGSLCAAAPSRAAQAAPDSVPLAEHPRPDFQRAGWMNLNGPWLFEFDPEDAGLRQEWFRERSSWSRKILVPFPWGSKLSGVPDQAPIAWYARDVTVPDSWRGNAVFLVVGASDWTTTAWFDGKEAGSHRGGYTPFEFEITGSVAWGKSQRLVIRVDDSPHPFKLEGKQGYGPARGIWQTVYLEARPAVHLNYLHFTPDVDRGRVEAHAGLNAPAPRALKLALRFQPPAGLGEASADIRPGDREVRFVFGIPSPRLWSLEDPFLYEVEASLEGDPGGADRVQTYFGMRKIGVVALPGLSHPYVALNNRPVYLQMTLDQAYHPDGFYTFASDAFMREEILRSRRIGLNGMRIHVKIDAPRKLYWADRLGMLIMADVPNSWGGPDPEMRAESEKALRGMIRRDYNHPSIFSWVAFNETWGLAPKGQGYLPETQDWVDGIVRLAKSLDPTRLVEDNSPDKRDHVLTDLNSWHAYLPGYAWEERLDQVSRDTYPGSTWNYIGGRKQGGEPMINSECGNVWGYQGSTGDVDWSWDYHRMLNEFRRHPKVAGWLYTEHHDVINEWNGYYRFDRSEKYTGLEELVSGMSLLDLHSPYYLAPSGELCRDVRPGEVVSVPIFASFMTDRSPSAILRLRTELYGWDRLGRRRHFGGHEAPLPFSAWMARPVAPVEVKMPDRPALAVLALVLEDAAGTPLHRNFVLFNVTDGRAPRDESVRENTGALRLIRFDPAGFSSASWSLKQWNVLEGLKVNGAGHGYFEYRLPWPAGLNPDDVSGVSFLAEASAKQLFGKDREGAAPIAGDFMRGRGTHDPSANPNSYPMTDTTRFPSVVRVRVAGQSAAVIDLPDDPADHRGVLSWHAQPRDRKLREAGSYGYLLNAPIPEGAWRAAALAGEIVLRLEVDAALPGGLAIYGERFGRYPLDPTLVFSLKTAR